MKSGSWKPALLGAVWLGALAAGEWVLLSYENTPGRAGQVPIRWPAASGTPRDRDRFTLVLFAHPRCPCTRATVEELAVLLTDCQDRMAVRILFLRPAEFAEGWERTNLWGQAAALPGVEVQADPGGAEARRFGVRTSGETLLYDAGGVLRFHGGITSARGHAGDNAGLAAIRSVVLKGVPGPARAPVFGCPLAEEISSDQAGAP